jgi:hypothetical protein
MFGLGEQEIIVLIIIIVIVGIFFIPTVKRFNEPKWRLRIGVVQAMAALSTYIWASNHSPYSVNYTWSFREGYYISIIVGVICYAILGIGNIVIGVLNTATDKKKNVYPLTKEPNSGIQNINSPRSFKFCSKCGANILSTDVFCSECGHALK